MEGYLEKYTNVIHGFRSRYFVLKDGYLCYGKTKNELPHLCRGSVCMGKAVIRASQNRTGAGGNSGYIFTVSVGRKKSIILKARDESLYTQWMDALREAQHWGGGGGSHRSTPNDYRQSPMIRNNSNSFYPSTHEESSGDELARLEPTSVVNNNNNTNELRSLLVSLQNQLFELQKSKLEFTASLNSLFEMDGTRLVELREEEGCNSIGLLAQELFATDHSFRNLAMESIHFITEGAALERESSLLTRRANEANNNRVASAKLLASVQDDLNKNSAENEAAPPSPLPSIGGEHQRRPSLLSQPSSPLWPPTRGSLVADEYSKLRRRFASRPACRTNLGLGPCAENLQKFLSSRSTSKTLSHKPSSDFSFELNLPLGCYEPLSRLQRMVEQLQCSYLLDRTVAAEGDPVSQMAHISAFVVSMAQFNANRVSYPFMPVEGETFEFCWETESESSVWVLCEHILYHHPGGLSDDEHSTVDSTEDYNSAVPISIMYAESDTFGWRLTVQSVLKYYLQYNSTDQLAVQNNTQCTLTLKEGIQFIWTMPDYVISTSGSQFVGKNCEQLWLNQIGSVEVSNNINNLKSTITFHKYSYFTQNKQPPNYVSAVIAENLSEPKLILQGQWNKYLESVNDLSTFNINEGQESSVKYWDVNEISGPNSLINYDIYNFSNFTLALNDFINLDFENSLPKTDTRFRNDLRALEMSELGHEVLSFLTQSKDYSAHLRPKYFSAGSARMILKQTNNVAVSLPIFHFNGAYPSYHCRGSSSSLHTY
ncbi:oxysterol-binding protein 1-like isoform X2 [Convolutriloba macropyga]|uniref:oxysterol-binding protein 1-like isoform X2 n=1 Tax=Convolutriloba macropyga TaxID=536237 RepID=UPI003F51BE98